MWSLDLDDWRIWWIVLLYNPACKGSFCHAIMSIAMVQKGLEPNGCGRSTLVKTDTKTDTNFF